MKNKSLRTLVVIFALALALSSLGVSGAQPKASSQAKPAQAKGTEGPCPLAEDVDANTAIERLKTGNLRWQSKMEERNWSEERKETALCGQHPFAVVVACMDSRVPPELIFDRGLGEIFVIRVAGPVLNQDELASLEYALVKKHVKLVLVLGHTDCGAVKGAVDRESGTYLPSLLRKIEPAVTYVSDRYNGGVRITSKQKKDLDRVSIANARIVHSEIRTRRALRETGVRITWGLYYLESGRVAFEPGDVEP
ncbi:MAG: carbonic anhydrase [Acidobacteria bacterium]|nr:MAG: carbonic anhydrase [Acidobacteriota bacterium]